MQVSRRALNIAPSATLRVSAKAADMKRAGVDVISLAAGEPDFDTPNHIKGAGIRSIRQGHTKYAKPSFGILELREAIGAREKRLNNIPYDESNIIVTVGAKEACFLACMCSLDEDDSAIVLTPFWPTYIEQIKFAGAHPISINVYDDIDYTLRSVAANVEEATKVIIINSPGNPSGRVFSKDLLLGLHSIAQKHDLIVISDEIYDELVYEEKHVSFASLNRDAFNRTITINGPSKTYAMTGWRLGYAAAPIQMVGAMRRVQSQTTSGAATFSQYTLEHALTTSQRCVAEMKQEYERRGKIMWNLINEIPGFHCERPQGAFYLFPDVSAAFPNLKVQNSVEFAEAVLEKAKVAVVPGLAFGCDNCVRMSYAASIMDIKEGVKRIRKLLDG